MVSLVGTIGFGIRANLQPPSGVCSTKLSGSSSPGEGSGAGDRRASYRHSRAMWKPGAQKPKNTPAAGVKDSKNDAVGGLKTGPNEPRSTTKSALSQKTLAMKFMQRKKTSADEKRHAIEKQKKDDTCVMDDNDDSNARVVCTRDVPDPSIPPIFGRRSFGGFNKAVEDEYREASRQTKFAESEERELREEVSAQEMASRMIKYTGLMRGPQGNRSNKKQRRA